MEELSEKEIKVLVEELCMRMPYGVHIQHMTLGMQGMLRNIQVFPRYDKNDDIAKYDFTIDFFEDGNTLFDGRIFRPVLIPISEMTEEHKRELEEIKLKYNEDVVELSDKIKKFFLKNHYDDRHLLEKGLAVLSLEKQIEEDDDVDDI